MGGEMIEMSLDSDQTINPWDLPKGESRPSNDQISFLKNLTRHMLGENTPPDLDIDLLDSVLLEAIASTYKRCSAKTSNPIPLFGDFAAELAHWQDRDRNQKINQMAQMASTKLRAWVDEGPYARLFDRPTTVQLNNPWLYFNVEKLKDDPRLERAMSLLIAHTATYRASGSTGQPSIVLLDECWALLESRFLPVSSCNSSVPRVSATRASGASARHPKTLSGRRIGQMSTAPASSRTQRRRSSANSLAT